MVSWQPMSLANKYHTRTNRERDTYKTITSSRVLISLVFYHLLFTFMLVSFLLLFPSPSLTLQDHTWFRGKPRLLNPFQLWKSQAIGNHQALARSATTIESCQETNSNMIYRTPLGIESSSLGASPFSIPLSLSWSSALPCHRALFKWFSVFSTRPPPRAP